MKRWCVCYVTKTKGVVDELVFGTYVLETEEHPVTIVYRWNEYEKKGCAGRGFSKGVSLISFHEVGPEVPLLDWETP